MRYVLRKRSCGTASATEGRATFETTHRVETRNGIEGRATGDRPRRGRPRRVLMTLPSLVDSVAAIRECQLELGGMLQRSEQLWATGLGQRTLPDRQWTRCDQ